MQDAREAQPSPQREEPSPQADRSPAADRFANRRASPSLHTEEMDEILARVPRWPVRWGASLLLVLLSVLLLLASVARYPRVVSAPIVLTTSARPSPMTVTSSGRVDRILVSEKDSVEIGDPMVILYSLADYDHMLQLYEWTRAFEELLIPSAAPAPIPELPSGLHVGMANDAYTVLQQRVSEYTAFAADRFHERRTTMLRAQMHDHERLARALSDQHRTALRARDLVAQAVQREELLLERGLTSETRMEAARAALLDREAATAQAYVSVVSAAVRSSEMAIEMADVEQRRLEQREALLRMAHAAAHVVRARIDEWRHAHVLRASTAGRVTFLESLRRGQRLEPSEQVLAIISGGTEIMGEMRLAESSVGHIRPGMAVRIALNSYPAAQYGAVEGVVTDVALMANREIYLAAVRLPDGISTNRQQGVRFHEGMTGLAKITTDDTSLLSRLTGSFNLLRERHLPPSASGK